MRAGRARAKIAASLKRRIDDPKAREWMKKLAGLGIKAVWPLRPMTERGTVFIPSRQLSEETQAAVQRLRIHIRAGRILRKFTSYPRFVTVSLIGWVTGFYATGKYGPVAFPVIAFGTSAAIAFGRIKESSLHKGIMNDLAFVSRSLFKVHHKNKDNKNDRVGKLLRLDGGNEYFTFFIDPKKNGIILTQLVLSKGKPLDHFAHIPKSVESEFIVKNTTGINFRDSQQLHVVFEPSSKAD